jgi:WD40 repeat protein
VLSGSGDLSGYSTLNLWDAASGVLIRTFEGHSGRVSSVAFSPDGARVLSGSDDNTLKLWDAATGALIRTFETRQQSPGGHLGWVHSVAFSSDGARVLSVREDNTLKLWDTATGALIRTFEGNSASVESVAFSPDGARVLSSDDGTLKLWDAATGALIRTFEGNSASAATDGARVLSGTQDPHGHNTLKLWDAATGALIRTFEEGDSWVYSVAFSPDGARVLSCSGDPGGHNTLKLWDTATGALVRTFKGHSDPIRPVAFSPDGARVLSGNLDDTLNLWDAASGALIRTFEGHSEWVSSVAFSPDGARVLSSCYDGTLKLWDAATGALIRTFEAHSKVGSVAYSRDGRHIASGSQDTNIRLWDPATGELAALIGGLKREWLAVTPKGFFAASPGGNELLAIVRGLDATTIGQVHQSLFNPDLVREALAGDRDGEVRKAAEIINLDKVLDSGPAPLVEITSRPPESKSNADLVAVSARISDRGKGIGRIEWRINGMTIGVTSAPVGAGLVYEVKRELALDPGNNAIEVVAYNRSNLLASLPAQTIIAYTGPPDRVKPKLHVLAIGINAYIDRGWKPPGAETTEAFPPLRLAVNDAIAFAAAMQEGGSGQYARVRATVALDTGATIAGLERIIDRVAEDVHPQDTFVLFVAAHGTSHTGRFYLIPQDYDGGANPYALDARAIGQDLLQDWVANRIKAKRTVLLFDTCESGALVGGYAHSRIDVPASEAAIGRLHEATGRPVLTAAATGKPALEGYKGHGVFTWALLDGLRNGDTNNNGTIELSELVAHVQALVPRISAELRGSGRAAVALSGSTNSGQASISFRQTARFGSRGEDFTLVKRLQ